MPVGTLRNLRVNDELWGRLQDRAKLEHETVSGLLRRICEAYLDGPAEPEPAPPEPTRGRSRLPAARRAVAPVAGLAKLQARPTSEPVVEPPRCARHPKAVIDRNGRCQTCRLEKRA